MSTTRNRTLGFVAGAVLAATLVSTSVALATIPSSTTGAITSCVSKKNGAVRIIDHQAGKRCASTERSVSWFQGPVARTFFVGRAALPVDRELRKIGTFTMPRPGAWTLAATTVVYVNVKRTTDGGPVFAGSVFGTCQLRRPDGRFIGGTDATTLTDTFGNGNMSLSFNAAFTATSTARTVTLWCRADNNTGGSVTATGAVGAQVLATRIGGFV